jgi:hypothetical protein
MDRRDFCQTAAALWAMPAIVKSSHHAGIRIEEVTPSYQDFHYRAPYKFGGVAVDRVTLLNVECVVSMANGRSAKGFGSMTMGNIWSFPSHVMTYEPCRTLTTRSHAIWSQSVSRLREVFIFARSLSSGKWISN